ncbi:MAG: hypothetical protein GC131_02895 [Alphaproteobacteria bacterium]|nr:hypothetical protein [Alphaproteobacteria bacterium]
MTRRRLILLPALAFLLAACGFSPVYGPGAGGADAPTAAKMNRIYIENIEDRAGQKLRNMLIDRMYIGGRPAQTDYRLDVKLTSYEADLAIRKDATSARSQLNMLAHYALSDRASGKVLLEGDTNAIASYNRVDAQYAVLAAEKNAQDRALRDISNKLINRISLFMANMDKAPASR